MRMFWAGERSWFRWVVMGKSTPDSARGGSPESEAKTGALPRFAPPLQDLDSTHPVGMVKNPACVPSGRRFAPGIPDLKAVRMVVRFVPYQQE
ncbi:MAG: hypothetical protein ACYCYP_08190 [Leptospirales bacterium]